MSGIFCAAFSLVCLVFVKNEPKDVGLPSIEAAAKKGAKGGKQRKSSRITASAEATSKAF